MLLIGGVRLSAGQEVPQITGHE